MMWRKLRNLFCWHKPADASEMVTTCIKCGREIVHTSQGWV